MMTEEMADRLLAEHGSSGTLIIIQCKAGGRRPFVMSSDFDDRSALVRIVSHLLHLLYTKDFERMPSTPLQ